MASLARAVGNGKSPNTWARRQAPTRSYEDDEDDDDDEGAGLVVVGVCPPDDDDDDDDADADAVTNDRVSAEPETCSHASTTSPEESSSTWMGYRSQQQGGVTGDEMPSRASTHARTHDNAHKCTQ